MGTNHLLTLCKASAGSGKTFTLAVSYITLLAMNPEAYRKILAVTFTNKATGEMKDRILSQLYGIAYGLPSSKGYLEAVQQKLADQGCREDINHHQLTGQQVRDNARQALTSILHNYSFFRIETIDSFMSGILRNMAKELSLGHNMDIELDQKKMIHNGVHDLIKELKPGAPEMSCILQYITDSIDNENAWDVRKKLEEFSDNLYRESYLRHSEELDILLSQESDTIAQLRSAMEQQRTLAAQATIVYVDRFFELADSIGAEATDFGYGASGPWGFFEKIKNGELPDIGNRVKDYARPGKLWGGSKSPIKNTVNSNSEKFQQLLEQTLTVYPRQLTVSHTTKLVLSHLYELQLMGSIDAKIKDTCRLSNRFLLADTCLMLKRMNTDSSDTSFIYEKTGTTFDHLLIDEFQDTSGLQWDNFRPLLEESTARNHQNLIVGDVKQSIYRWRGSDAEIMSKRVDEELGHIQPRTETLGTNYRSRQHIVEFNNRFFKTLTEQLTHLPDTCDATDIAACYSDVEQKWKADRTGGSVQVITVVQGPEERTSAEAGAKTKKTAKAVASDGMCRTTVQTIIDLLKKGLKQNDIAILTRKNDDIAALATWMAAHPDELEGYPLRLVSGEAFQLDASEMVTMLVGCLRWICNEDDKVSLLKVAHTWHSLVGHDSLTLSDIIAQEPEGHYGLPEALFAHYEMLKALPLMRQLYTLYDLLGLAAADGHDAWLQTFFDIAQSYASDECGDTAEFLTEWDERLAKKAIPSGDTDGIPAMTIHKSKGLEFHTVIIPFCDWTLEKNGSTLWVETGADRNAFADMPCLPVTRCNEMADSAFTNAYKEETKQVWIDNLNLLYVAFTRPTSNLIVIRSAMATTQPPKDVSAFIDLGLRDITLPVGDVCTTCSEKHTSAEHNPLLPDADTIPVAFHSAEPSLVFRQSNSSRTYINRGDDSPLSPFIEQGNLLHEVFAHITTAADAPAAIGALFTQGIIDAAKRDELTAVVSEALRHEEVQSWFDGRYTLFNECTILTTDENGNPAQLRPDRVMTDGTRTLVVDFKFGKKSDKHVKQVRAYMDLLTAMGYPQVEGYLWYVLLNEITPLH